MDYDNKYYYEDPIVVKAKKQNDILVKRVDELESKFAKLEEEYKRLQEDVDMHEMLRLAKIPQRLF